MPIRGRTLVFCALMLSWPGTALADLGRPAWTVQAGDALILIAQRFNVTVDELKSWNGLEGDMIRIGQKLVVGPQYIATSEVLVSVPPAPILGPANDEIDWTPPFEYEEIITTIPSEPSSAPIASATIPVPVSAVPERKPAPAPKTPPNTYRIKSGDTLTGIASRFGTTVRAIVKANPGIKPDRIFPGQTIAITEPRPEMRYIVERGDTLAGIAARHDATKRQLYAWNPQIRRRSLRPNTTIRLYTTGPVSQSESLGAPNSGRLRRAMQLPRHKGYVIRTPGRAWGTEETIRWIVEGFDAVTKRFRHKKRVRVHDISDTNGGRLRDHKSHQSGRDVDISYYQTSCARGICPFESFRPKRLDVQRQWTLLHHWLKNGQAELIFIDYRLQAPLYRYAKRRGASRAQLAKWFQYPRGKSVPTGVIRHFRNHRDHLHARFVCPYSDRDCR